MKKKNVLLCVNAVQISNEYAHKKKFDWKAGRGQCFREVFLLYYYYYYYAHTAHSLTYLMFF